MAQRLLMGNLMLRKESLVLRRENLMLRTGNLVHHMENLVFRFGNLMLHMGNLVFGTFSQIKKSTFWFIPLNRRTHFRHLSANPIRDLHVAAAGR